MLGWLFGKGKQAVRAEDSVWMSRAAMRAGLAREVERLARAGASVLLGAFRPSEVDDWHSRLAALEPERCRDAFKHDALRRQLGKPGSVTVALAGELPGNVAERDGGAVEILVCGRNESRATDDAVLRFADLLGTGARVAFHLSLEDPLLQQFTGSIRRRWESSGGRTARRSPTVTAPASSPRRRARAGRGT